MNTFHFNRNILRKRGQQPNSWELRFASIHNRNHSSKYSLFKSNLNFSPNFLVEIYLHWQRNTNTNMMKHCLECLKAIKNDQIRLKMMKNYQKWTNITENGSKLLLILKNEWKIKSVNRKSEVIKCNQKRWQELKQTLNYKSWWKFFKSNQENNSIWLTIENNGESFSKKLMKNVTKRFLWISQSGQCLFMKNVCTIHWNVSASSSANTKLD